MERFCPNGHKVDDYTKFCPQCGFEIKDVTTCFCPKCGKERTGKERFCSKCGFSFSRDSSPDLNRQSVKKDGRKIPVTLIISVVAILVVAVFFISHPHLITPEEPIKQDTVQDANEYVAADIFAADTIYSDEYDDMADPTDDRYAWLQGHWVYEQGSFKGHLIIKGNKVVSYSNMSSERDEYSYRIEDDAIRATIMDGVDFVIKIDFANHRLDYGNGNWMHKIEDSDDDNSSFNEENISSLLSASEMAELNTLKRIKELNNLSLELTNEIAVMRSSGQMDPLRFTSITQRLLQYKQEQISLAERLGDDQLVYEYQQQYSKLIDAIRMMENGY